MMKMGLHKRPTAENHAHHYAGRIKDGTYRTKFIELPDTMERWLSDEFRGKDILDFGCGEGTTALGIALLKQARRVVGIDIMSDFNDWEARAAEQLGLETPPANLHFQQVNPGSLHDECDKFDLIYSWSAFEHVDQELLVATLELLRNALKPGGLLLIQIAPLFYSEDGGHLMSHVTEPWGHLTNQHTVYLGKLRKACSSNEEYESLRSMFETLNKLTADELISLARSSGFSVAKEYRMQRKSDIPRQLHSVYQRAILLDEQVVLLLKPVD